MKTAAAYIRVSTDDQTEYSPDSQLKLLREFAKKNDYILPDEYIFQDDGISGRKAENRPEFMRMIATAKTKPKPFDVVLVWKYSRFARSRVDSVVFKSLLRKQLGIDVVSISEPIGNDKTSILTESLFEAMDEFYSMNLSEEVKRGMHERFERGEIVTPPSFGYDVKDGIYVPNPEEAPVVRKIFDMYLNGIGKTTIARSIGAEGVRTKRGNIPDNRFVSYILENPVYIGKIRWSKDGRASSTRYHNKDKIITKEGKHEPIIDTDTWNAVQAKLDSQAKSYKRYQRREQPVEFMLKGLVRCDSCGSTLCQSVKGVGIQCHSYLRGTCKVSHYISLIKINKAVLEALQTAIDTMSFNIAPQNRPTSSAPDIDKLIANEMKKLERVKLAYENGIDTLDEYIANKTKIQAQIKKLQAECPQKETFSKKAYAKKVKSVLDILNSNAT